MFGNGGLRYSVTMGGIMRGRLFKVLGIALVVFTAMYFILPWSSSFAPLERSNLLSVELTGRDNEKFVVVVYESLFETS